MTGGRILPQALRFLGRRKRVLRTLGSWSLLESLQTFVGGYSVAKSLDQGFLAGRPGTGLLWLALAVVAALAGGLATRGVFRGLAELVEPLRDALIRRVTSKALAEAMAGVARSADSAVVSRLTHQTEIARDSFAGLVLVARSFLFTTAGALAGLASLAPQLLLVVVPPLALGLLLFTATLIPMAACQRDFLRADEALATQTGALAQGLRDVVACGATAQARDLTCALIENEARTARALARWAAARTLALAVAGQLPVVLLLAAAPWLLRQGVTAGTLAGAMTYLMQALLPALHTLVQALGAAGTRLLVVLDRLTAGTYPDPLTSAAVTDSDFVHPTDGRQAPAVELRTLTFAYRSDAQPVLRDLSLTIAPGEHLAVVGPSGIGKSTLTALIAGLLTPGKGQVRVHGEQARISASGEPSRLRVLIPQQAYVFSGTLRENLQYLCPGGASATAMRHSAEAVGAAPLIRRLGGYDAVADPAALSPGECQLIALARAHLSPARLILLDEATCHLDPAAEAQAEAAFAARPGTVIVVAHRISSAQRADRVLVLDGVHAALGTHEQMLDQSPLYRDLVGQWHAERL